MKMTCIGVSNTVFHWTDKRSGNQRAGFKMFFEYENKREVVGLKSIEVFVDDTFDCFEQVAIDIEYKRAEKYQDAQCNVEFDENAKIIAIDFLDID